MIRLKIPLLPLLPNRTLRQHWLKIKQEKDRWHVQVLIHAKKSGFRGGPLQHARITFVRRSNREPDFDNLVGSFKFVMDGLVKAGILADDKRAVVGQPDYRWEFVKKGSEHIEVVVEGINDNRERSEA